MHLNPPNREALAVDEWPEQDRCAWSAACGEEHSLLDISPVSSWRTSSRELFVRQYGMWLRWLIDNESVDPESAPASRMNRERLIAYLQARQARGNSAKTLVSHACGLLAMHKALVPDADWRWMDPIIARLKSHVKPTEKHSNLPSVRELVELGLVVMQKAEVSDASLWTRAIMYRNGLAIAMLAARPFMRRQNVSTIRIGEHLVREAGVYRLRFEEDEMKGRKARGGPLPHALTHLIDHYIDHYRPRLLGGQPDDQGALWISNVRRPIYPHAFSNEIGKVTEAALGRRITMHEFRHAAASSVAKEDPEHVAMVATILGHASFGTSEKYYIIAEEHAAFQRFHKALECLLSMGPD